MCAAMNTLSLGFSNGVLINLDTKKIEITYSNKVRYDFVINLIVEHEQKPICYRRSEACLIWCYNWGEKRKERRNIYACRWSNIILLLPEDDTNRWTLNGVRNRRLPTVHLLGSLRSRSNQNNPNSVPCNPAPKPSVENLQPAKQPWFHLY